jgi:hypothetical protein
MLQYGSALFVTTWLQVLLQPLLETVNCSVNKPAAPASTVTFWPLVGPLIVPGPAVINQL